MKTWFVALMVLLPGQSWLTAMAAETGGFFVYGEIVRSDVERSPGVSDRVDGRATGYTLGAGYSWSQHFALRAAYRDFGDIDATIGCPPDVFCVSIVPFARDQVELDGFVVELLGSYPLRGTPFSLTAKLGLLDWDANWKNNSRLDDNGNELLYGVGVRWSATDKLSVHLGLEQSGFDTDAIVGGLAVRF